MRLQRLFLFVCLSVCETVKSRGKWNAVKRIVLIVVISFLSWAKGKVGDTIDYLVIQVSMALQKPLRGLSNKADNDYNFLYCSLIIFLGNLSGMYEWNKKKISVDINIWYTPPHDSACSWNKHPTSFLWFLMMYCAHCSPTGCLAARVALVCDWLVFSRFFSRSLKSQSQV